MSKKIVGFNDLRKREEEEEHGQEYYTGGVDNRGGGSGLNVVDPVDNDRRGGGGLFNRILERASADTREISGSGTPAATAHTITLYRNGFTLNDGPFRPVTEPENMVFLQNLMKGTIPPELRSENGDLVDINLVDKHAEEYTAPAYTAFSGQANVLSSTSTAQGFPLSSIPAAPALTSEPSILTQVKTPDGKKLKIKVNSSRTVLEYIAAILAQAKASGSRVPEGGSISISAGFPPLEITQGDISVVDAGLTSASVTYKFI